MPQSGKRKKITIDHTRVAAPLNEFPVLVATTEPDLKTAENGGFVAQADGSDVYFTKAEAAAELFHQEMAVGDVSQIYINADTTFRLASTYDAAVISLQGARSRFGMCDYSGPLSWRVNVGRNGSS